MIIVMIIIMKRARGEVGWGGEVKKGACFIIVGGVS